MGSAAKFATLLASLVSLPLGTGVAATGSADEGRILFESHGELHLADVASGAVTKLGIQGGSAAWSPDGRRIAFISNPYRQKGEPSELFVVNADGSGRQKLTGEVRRAATPDWAPNGERIAFADFDRVRVRTGLYVIDSDGSDLRQLVEGSEPIIHRWSPDGRTILYVRRSGKFWDLFKISAAGGEGRRLARRVNYSSIAWSPDGSKISFSQHGRLRVASADGTGSRRLTKLHVFGHHSWAPDGSRIAFENRGGGTYSRTSDIYSVRPDGTDLRRLTRESERRVEDLKPTWSPTGTKIAFTSSREGGPEIYVMNADGTCEVRGTRGVSVMSFLDWQPVRPESPSPRLRCTDLRLTGAVDVAAGRVSRDDDRIYLYRLGVVNDGNEMATSVRLEVPSPREATFVSASTRDGRCTVERNVVCDLMQLPPDSTAGVTIRFRIRLRTRWYATISTEAAVAAAQSEPNERDNRFSLTNSFPFCRAPDSETRTENVWPLLGQSICGTPRRDRIVGSSGQEAIYGANGDDVLRGRGGPDYVVGGNGSDEVRGGSGGDTILGGSGHDRLVGGPGKDGLLGASGDDVLLARDRKSDNIVCGQGRDRVFADVDDRVSRDCEQISRRG
jgi:TolB protein